MISRRSSLVTKKFEELRGPLARIFACTIPHWEKRGRAGPSRNLIIAIRTTPLPKLFAINPSFNHHPFSQPKLHEYSTLSNLDTTTFTMAELGDSLIYW